MGLDMTGEPGKKKRLPGSRDSLEGAKEE